jgi:2-dehydropantoate 2-reductase
LFSPQTPVLTLQNGWGNAEDILQYSFLGTTAHGGNVLGPGKVRHAGQGKTCIGVRSGTPGRAQRIADLLTESGFETIVSDNVAAMIWHKLLINTAINPLTALLNEPNGYLVECPATSKLMENLIREGVLVANAAGMEFNPVAVNV